MGQHSPKDQNTTESGSHRHLPPLAARPAPGRISHRSAPLPRTTRRATSRSLPACGPPGPIQPLPRRAHRSTARCFFHQIQREDTPSHRTRNHAFHRRMRFLSFPPQSAATICSRQVARWICPTLDRPAYSIQMNGAGMFSSVFVKSIISSKF